MYPTNAGNFKIHPYYTGAMPTTITTIHTNGATTAPGGDPDFNRSGHKLETGFSTRASAKHNAEKLKTNKVELRLVGPDARFMKGSVMANSGGPRN
jgi:hypothetical protein